MRYFKSYTESDDGDEGVFYCEVENDEIVRHVSVFAHVMYWATPTDEFDELYSFTDQPQFCRDEYDAEISAKEFLAMWTSAINQEVIE